MCLYISISGGNMLIFFVILVEAVAAAAEAKFLDGIYLCISILIGGL
jgi:hypothetical protein